MFEGGNEDEEGRPKRKEQIKIDGCPAAKNLRERFEKGLSISEEQEDQDDRKEIDHVFRQAGNLYLTHCHLFKDTYYVTVL